MVYPTLILEGIDSILDEYNSIINFMGFIWIYGLETVSSRAK